MILKGTKIYIQGTKTEYKDLFDIPIEVDGKKMTFGDLINQIADLKREIAELKREAR